MSTAATEYRHPGIWQGVKDNVRRDRGAARSDTADQRAGVRVNAIRYPFPNTLGLTR